MLVKAKRLGFYKGNRKYPGEVFEIPNPEIGKDGKPKPHMVSKWADEVKDQNAVETAPQTQDGAAIPKRTGTNKEVI